MCEWKETENTASHRNAYCRDTMKPLKRRGKREAKSKTRDGKVKKSKVGQDVKDSAFKVAITSVKKVAESEKSSGRIDDKLLESKKEVEIPEQNADELSTDQKGFRYLPIDQNLEYHGILLLKKCKEVAILGRFLLQVLCGSITINGYQQRKDDTDLSVCSLSSYSLYTLLESSERSENEHELSSVLDKNLLNTFGLKKKSVLKKKYSSVVLIKRMNHCSIDFISTIKSYGNLLTKSVEVYSLPACPYFTLQIDQWEKEATKILDNVSDQGIQNMKVVISGATDLGKSSFGRFFINKTLSRFNNVKSIFYLDCDLGQTEFTPPGCVSLTEIQEPLFGPPFTHMKSPVRCQYYGEVSPKERPYFYIDCIRDVLDYYTEHFAGSAPLIVNTQGWVKGLGLPLLLDVLRMVKPNVIIQFTSKNNPSKRMIELNDDAIQKEPGWGYQRSEDEETQTNSLLKQDVLYVDIPAFEREKEEMSKLRLHITSADYRRLALLSYFGRMEQKSYQNYRKKHSKIDDHCWIPRPFEEFVPYQVFLKDVAVHVGGVDPEKELILRAINWSVVALAKVPESSILPASSQSDGVALIPKCPICECLGYGIVRNIDIKKEILYILTPEPYEVLQHVNALLKGAIELPQALFSQKTEFYQMSSKVQEICGAKPLKPRFNLLRKGQTRDLENKAAGQDTNVDARS